MAHLEGRGIKRVSDQLGADDLSNQIIKSALDPFRWNVTLSVSAPGDICEPIIEVGMVAPQPNLIRTLLNAAEHIAIEHVPVVTQDQ